jgi:uncharacterized membrane protein YkvI|tara:strand:- start:581 stop:1687 length:1107 start_codon:yes stop_codon:yes gene_type:complete
VNRFFRIYLLPGAVLQSVMIGGGYGTGREVVEFFSGYGMGGAVLAIATAALSAAVVFAVSLEFARCFKAHDYRVFFKALLGRGWVIYELLAVALFVLVIAVLGAAAGEVLYGELGLAPWVGMVVVLVVVVVLNFYGRGVVTAVLAYWSVLLYAVFIAYFVLVLTTLYDADVHRVDFSDVQPGWWLSGIQYACYNLTAVPVILYAAYAIETRAQAVAAGAIGAVIAMLPALFLHLSFVTEYPAILDAALPVYDVLGKLSIPMLTTFYLIVLFGTFIETGAGIIQGVIERLDGWWVERHGTPLTRLSHAVIAATGVGLAGLLSSVGIVALIAEGYGTLAWGFLIVYIVPLLTVGVWRIHRHSGDSGERSG